MEKKQFPWATIVGTAIKGSKFIKIIKAAKALKYSKYLITIVTMFLSALVYGVKMGLPFGIGLVLLIFIHEMGHVWALTRKGIRASAPVFIPLLGAVVFAPRFEDRATESYVGFGGPFIGTIASLIPLGLYFLMPAHADLMIILAFIGTWINCFNMLPVRPLDGGRILQSVGPWHKWIGLTLLIIMIGVFQAPGLMIILLFSIDDFLKLSKKRFYLKLIIGGAMFAMYAIGLGTRLEFWIDIVLFALIMGFDANIFRKNFKDPVDEPTSDELRPYPEAKVRHIWLVNYLLLLAGQIVLMVYIAQLMPEMPK